jgi:nucleoside-diphosphate-sugar epimerase
MRNAPAVSFYAIIKKKGGKNMETVLITGISGFVGATLAVELYRRGYNVTGVDRSDSPKNKELAALVKNGRVRIFQGDLNTFDYDMLPYADYVFQIAGKVSPWGDLADFDRINVDGTKRAIDFAKKAGSKSFLYLSSVAVYGYDGYKNRKEEDEKHPFDNPYSISKLHAETMVMKYCKELGLPYVVIRPGNVYGPNDFTSSYQIYSLIEKGKMPYIDHGRYVSCFVYVGNLVDAIATAGTTPAAWNEDYNITDGFGETLHEYFALVAETMGVKPRFISLPGPLAKAFSTVLEGAYKLMKSKKAPFVTRFSTYQNCADYHFSIAKAKRIFGYEPKTSLKEGVRNTVDWYLSLKGDKA